MSTKRATRGKKSQTEHLIAAIKSQKLQLPDGYATQVGGLLSPWHLPDIDIDHGGDNFLRRIDDGP